MCERTRLASLILTGIALVGVGCDGAETTTAGNTLAGAWGTTLGGVGRSTSSSGGTNRGGAATGGASRTGLGGAFATGGTSTTGVGGAFATGGTSRTGLGGAFATGGTSTTGVGGAFATGGTSTTGVGGIGTGGTSATGVGGAFATGLAAKCATLCALVVDKGCPADSSITNEQCVSDCNPAAVAAMTCLVEYDAWLSCSLSQPVATWICDAEGNAALPSGSCDNQANTLLLCVLEG